MELHSVWDYTLHYYYYHRLCHIRREQFHGIEYRNVRQRKKVKLLSCVSVVSCVRSISIKASRLPLFKWLAFNTNKLSIQFETTNRATQSEPSEPNEKCESSRNRDKKPKQRRTKSILFVVRCDPNMLNRKFISQMGVSSSLKTNVLCVCFFLSPLTMQWRHAVLKPADFLAGKLTASIKIQILKLNVLSEFHSFVVYCNLNCQTVSRKPFSVNLPFFCTLRLTSMRATMSSYFLNVS